MHKINRDKISIIAPGDLPIPATKGGAIETLITNFIDQNEKEQKVVIEVYSFYDEEAEKISRNYKFCKFNYFYIDKNISRKLIDISWRLARKLSGYRMIYQNDFLRYFKKKLREEDAKSIIIEGNIEYVRAIRKYSHSNIYLHVHTDILNESTVHANKIIESCDGILTVSKYIKQRILDIDNKNSAKISVLYNCIDLDLFNFSKSVIDRSKMRNQYGLKEDDTLLLFCGRVDATKGVLEIVEAYNMIDYDKVKLIVIGGSWFSNNAESKYIKELKKFSKEIIFTGYVDHDCLPQYYSAADIAIFPSKCNEAAGLVIIEACAMGIPVVTTNVGGIPEYLGSCGVLIENNDSIVNSIKDNIEKIVYDDALKKNLQHLAIENSSKFSTATYYRKYLEHISSYV